MSPNKISFKFDKNERLRHKKLINKLFNRNNNDLIRVSEFPYILLALELTEKNDFDKAAQVLINIPKKYNKKAVDRNRKKRQIKEIYRLNKHKIYKLIEKKNKKFALMIIFIGRGSYKFLDLEKGFYKLFDRMKVRFDKI